MKKTITIICAAIIDTNEKVWIGKRHNDCFFLMDRFGVNANGCYQGFMTSENEFVSRFAAKIIATEAGQLIEDHDEKRLFSEDIY